MTTIAVTGGRHFSNRELVYRILDVIHAEVTITLLVHGNCQTGADQLAAQWADSRGVLHTGKKWTANWKIFGNAAGPMRNRAMLRTEKPTRLVAFPGDKGTNGCCGIAEKLGIEVRRIEG